MPDLNFFASKFMNNCDDFQILVTRINNTPYFVSKVKYRNLNSFLLILLSGDPSLNPGPSYQHKLQSSNKCDIFKTRGLYALSISTLIVCCQKSRNFESWLSQLMPQLYVLVNINYMILYWNIKFKLVTITISGVVETDTEKL